MLKEAVAFGGMIVAVVFGLTEQHKATPVDVDNPPAVSAPQKENEQGEGQDFTTPTWCQLLKEQDSYSYTYQDAMIFVPDGVALFTEIVEDGHKGSERENICKILVDEHDTHMNNNNTIIE